MMLSVKPRTVISVLAALTATFSYSSPQTANEAQDRYQWLEDVNGERSTSWVRAENQRSEKAFRNDPVYGDLEVKALKVLESPQRLATPQLNGSDVLNVWQDAQHVQGILRRTTVNDYLTASPHWQTLIDYDALSKQDGQKWVAHGTACLYPGNTVCMIALSSGGEDAVTMREFNMQTGKFVAHGFVLPRSNSLFPGWIKTHYSS